jgi:hypothetical protein
MSLFCHSVTHIKKNQKTNTMSKQKKLALIFIGILLLFTMLTAFHLLFHLEEEKCSENVLLSSFDIINELQSNQTQEYIYTGKQMPDIYEIAEDEESEENLPFSWFRFVGSGGYHNPNKRITWHFQNICYRRETDQFEYYIDPNERILMPVLFEIGGRIEYQFGNLGRKPLKIVHSPMPTNSIYYDAKVAVVQENVLLTNNDGHFLLDNIFPSFHALRLLGLPTLDQGSKIIWIPPIDCNEKCKYFMRHWILNYQIANDISNSFNELQENELTCFDNLVTNIDHFKFYNFEVFPEMNTWSLGDSYRCFRDYIRYKIAKLKPSDKAEKHQILISINNGGRKILNSNELFKYLSKIFPDIAIKILNLQDISPKNQLEILSNTTVIISPSGINLLSTLLSADDTVGIFPDFGKPNGKDSQTMEQPPYQIFPWFTAMKYPVISQTKITTPNASIRSDTASIAKNFIDLTSNASGGIVIDIKQVTQLVYSALKRIQNKRGMKFKFNDRAFKRYVLQS